MYPTFYVEAGDTLPILFDTFDGGTGASITLTGLAVTDVEIYADGGVTQRASDSGITLLDTDGIDFDGITGIHGFSIDLSDNDDAGFYVVGSWYHVVVSAVTIDAQTVNFIAAAFRIVSATRGLAGTALPDAAADAAGGLPISDAGGLDLDTQIGTDIDAILVDTAEIGAAGAGLSAVPWNAAWDAEVQSEAADALVAYDPPTKAELDSGLGALNDPTAATIADAVLDEALAGHVTAGTLGKAVGDIETDAAAILVDTAEIGAAGAGLTEAGGTGDQLTALATAANLATVDTVVDAIKAVTDNLPDAGALTALVADVAAILVDTGTTLDAKLDAIAGYIDTEVAAILVDTGTTIPGLIAALNDLSAAAVNAEVVDVLRTDTIPDAVNTAGVMPTIAEAIYLILQALTDHGVSGTTDTIRAIDGATTLATLTLDDATDPTDVTRAT